MKARITGIVLITLIAILWLSLSEGEMAAEVRAFLRALLRALF